MGFCQKKWGVDMRTQKKCDVDMKTRDLTMRNRILPKNNKQQKRGFEQQTWGFSQAQTEDNRSWGMVISPGIQNPVHRFPLLHG